MASIVLKNIPPELHQHLKERAHAHHRSLTQEILTILEAGSGLNLHRELPPLRKGSFPLTEAWLNKVKREGLE